MNTERLGGARRLALILALSFAAALLIYEGYFVAADLRGDFDLHDAEHVGSTTCEGCHHDNARSYRRTHHGRMTQEAGEETVLGEFDGRTLTYGGVEATMERGPAGEYRMRFAGPAPGERRTAEVVRTVGSHRYQQYLARVEDVYVRLPIAWHPGEGRFFHMNGAFLTPDPTAHAEGGAISRDDYDRHVVRWNDNCVFCHNVAPNPGLTGERFETEVAELGVACEACHGPGGRHVEARSDPLRSLALTLAEDDMTIVSAEDLSAELSADICGRCHGQRITDDISSFLERGDPFVPGDELSLYSAPLFRDTTLDGDEGVFAARFWRDGTPRLTAYAYQGLLMSPCAQRGELTCTTCHGMHEGDPAGQLRPEALGDGACVDCHEELGRDDQLEAHAHHPANSSGARCTNCHMPNIVYGLIGAHVSHRIENPNPARAAATHRPDACTLCHVEETREWAVARAADWWGTESETETDSESETETDSEAESDSETETDSEAESETAPLPEVLRALFAGDPIERAVAAEALGAPRRAASAGSRPARLGALLDVMMNDPYPAVRHIAWRSARTLADAADAPFPAYVPTGTRDERAIAIEALRAALPPDHLLAPDPREVAQLREAAAEVAINIGE